MCKIYSLLVLLKCSIKAKQRVRICKDYVIGRETKKIAMESVTFKLCDSRDYFASSLLGKKTD